MSHQIVISEFMDEAAVARLSAAHDTLYDPTLVDDPVRLSAALRGATALIVRNRTRVTAELLDQAPNLTCVGRLGVGLDNIDLEACENREATVYPATGANTLAVAEYVITAAMMLLRGAYLSTASVAAGDWPRNALIGQELSSKTMGLVGFGGIARAVASRAQALGMATIAHDPFLPEDDPAWHGTRRASVQEVLAKSDVVSLHVPLTDATRNMIDAKALETMRKGAVLINTARGGIVDETALAAALTAGRIGGAALDVFAQEPLPAEIGGSLGKLPNVILTPHIAGVTEQSNVRVSDLIATRVLDHLAG